MDSSAELESMDTSEGEEFNIAPVKTKAEMRRLQLKLIAAYAMDGFAPLVAVIAVVVAVIALNANKSSRVELSQSTATIETLSATLKASRGELEKLKATVLQGKAVQDELQSKQEESVRLIVQQVSKLQEKLKISPTLEAQLLQPVSAKSVQ